MEQEKRTDKIKKRTFGGYYAVYKRWDSRGKSSKDLKLMIEDLKDCITHQLVRIKHHKAVIDLLKQRDSSKNELHQLRLEHSSERLKIERKLDRREGKIESLDEKISNLDYIVREQDKEILRLNKEIEKKDEVLESAKPKVVVKKVIVDLTPEAKRLQRIADKGVDQRTLNSLEYTTRTLKFLKENDLSLEYLSIITQAELMGNVKTTDVGANYKALNKIVSLGYLSFSTGLIGASKYWFVSLKGKELLKKYKNYLSYGKSILN